MLDLAVGSRDVTKVFIFDITMFAIGEISSHLIHFSRLVRDQVIEIERFAHVEGAMGRME